MPRTRPRTFDRSQLPPGAAARGCDHPGCAETGEFRAPRSRSALTDYFWFCLEHVREYNSTWDFYRGMTGPEIEASRRSDLVGNRPSWPLGARGPKHYRLNQEDIAAALHRFFELDQEQVRPRRRPPTPEEEALAVLELESGATQAEIKARYKELAKIHHPDANGGDKEAENRLKTINQAYTFLKSLHKQAARQDAAAD